MSSFSQWPLLYQVLTVAGLCSAGIFVYNANESMSIRRRAAARGCKPPPSKDMGMMGLPQLFKNVEYIKNHCVLGMTVEGYEKMGANTYSVSMLGMTILSTRDPQNIQSILATDFASFGLARGRRGVVPLLGEGIFVTDGAAWKHSRELLRPSFNRAHIADMDLFARHVDRLVQVIPRDGQTVDLFPLFTELAMDISTDFLFDRSTNVLAPGEAADDVAKFVAAWQRCTDYLSNPAMGTRIKALFFTDADFAANCKIVHDFADGVIRKFIDDKAGQGEHRYSFLSALVEQTTSPEKLRTELLSILLAGRETTAALLTNLFFTLSRRPDIQARLREEIAGLAPEDLSFEVMRNLPYLRAFINESLRLYPLLPLNSRDVLRDTVLPVGGGVDGKSPVFLPKGSSVGYNVYAMHRNKDVYGEDAEEFKPERWLDQDGRKGIRPGWAYLPFNGGPRICIGRKCWAASIIPRSSWHRRACLVVLNELTSLEQFALTETSYVLIRLLQEFPNFESRDSEPWTENLQFTCSSLNGCKLAVTSPKP